MCVCEGPLKIAREPAWFYETQIKYQWFNGRYNANQILDLGLRRNMNTGNGGGRVIS